MKIYYKQFFILFFFCVFCSNLVRAESTAFIDIDYILNNSNLGKSIYLDLEKLNKKNLKSLESKEEKIKKKKDSIENKSNVSTKEQLQKEIDLFKKEVNQYRAEKNKLLENFKIKKKK